MGRRRGVLAAALLPLALLACGCGGPGATSFSASANPNAGGEGTLSYAIPPLSGQLDPLPASSLPQQTVTRQIFEPLVATLDGPFNQAQNTPGLALGWNHSSDLRVWSFQLRAGVTFQDGTPLNAGAVLVNVQRWRTSALGRVLLPGLIGADSPRPGLVRFIFTNPVGDLPGRLGDVRLGLVSPGALSPASGARATLSRAAEAGSGPFQLSNRSPSEVDLTRYRGWWGSRIGLGPALDQVAFRLTGSEPARLELLRSGAVRVAGELGASAAASLVGDPLLTADGISSGHAIGFERSVRGIGGIGPVALSGVWLALVAG